MGRRKDRDDDNDSEEEDSKVETKDHKSRSKSRKDKKRSRRDDDDDDDDVKESDDRSDDDDDDDSEDTRERRRRRKKDRRRKKKDSKKKRKRSRSKKRSRREESDDSDGSDDSDDDSGSGDDSEEERQRKPSSKKKSKKDKNKAVMNKRLLEKLEARGETLEEREARRAQRRAARITAKFGYTADENPFNDPNIHETFTWKKKGGETKSRQNKQDEIFGEIEKVRQRRKDRELEFEEMQRIRAEESRMRELENYDEWARKEEEFHLLQQRQRSAIRLVEGREKPIDVLAKNMLMFGLSADEMENRAKVKYQEKYSALSELENLEAELEEPHQFLKVLKLNELEELLGDIDAFRRLEREALGGGGLSLGNQDSPVLRYWDNIHLVASDEIKYLRNGGAEGARATTLADVQKLFKGQSKSELVTMRGEVEDRLRKSAHSAAFNGTGAGTDMDYWRTVLEQLDVYLARSELSELHCKMLARQLERLERRKKQLEAAPSGKDKDGSVGEDGEGKSTDAESAYNASNESMRPKDAPDELKNLDEELGLSDELDLGGKTYAWQDKYRPRKPRYFNRVKTGYDWNKYNQTHYDHENPPPKTVQGYKFNVFYPDLIDRTKTPKFFLEKADTDEFCVIRFHAGPPYEDVAFKIINREWKRSRKHGFRCTFERGVLSLYFNFKTHWYRR